MNRRPIDECRLPAGTVGLLSGRFIAFPVIFATVVSTGATSAWGIVAPASRRAEIPAVADGDAAVPENAGDAMSGSIAIELRSRAEIESPRVLLDQIALCIPARTKNFDCAEVLAVDAGSSPAPGKTSRFSRAALTEILGNEFPGARIEVIGPDSAFVTARGIPLADEALVQQFRQEMDDIFSGNAEFRVQVTGLRIESRPQVRPGNVSCRFSQLELLRQRAQDPSGTSIEADLESLVTRIHNGAQFNAQCVSKDYQDARDTGDGEAQGDAHVSFDPPYYVQFSPRILVERNMPVARHDLPAKMVFRGEDAVMAWVPWTRSAGRAVRDTAALVGMSLVKPVQAGQTLLLRDFERPVVLRRGDTVQLQQKNGDLTVTVNAVVITQGAVGERVEVQAVATKKRMRAVIKSNSVVEAM